MQIDNLFEVLKFFNGNELDDKKLINSAFNRIINKYFSSTPLVLHNEYCLEINEQEIKFESFFEDNLTPNYVLNKRVRIQQLTIYIRQILDEKRLFDYLNRIQHIWENGSLEICLLESISIENFEKIFTKLAKNCKKFDLILNDESITNLFQLKEIIIDYLENNFGIEFNLPKGFLLSEDFYQKYEELVIQIINQLKQVI